MAEGRIARRFARLGELGRAGLVTFVTAGDPDLETSDRILQGLPGAGADFIEIGMPFSDPTADGPVIQAASERALTGGQNMARTLDQVRSFRERNDETPLILMGYFNPIYVYGNERFMEDAGRDGVDGLIIVDLPPEEDELREPAARAGLDLIYLTAPTTPEARMRLIAEKAGGFIYYVSITGITGTRSAQVTDVGKALENLRRHIALPIAIGFGIRTPDQARAMGGVGDAVVVGSALIEQLVAGLDEAGKPLADCADGVLNLVRDLAQGLTVDG
ncbi:MAG: tryptophan synthase subunit alpha [Rhodospirillales bacterium]|jgi:tryptophan synthase alpha chain|nr:tryptophan synthase subunit alpha [Rhodospirillales bacterium]